MKKRSGIYTITHVASGKQYVGQSASIRDRWLWHKSSLRRGASANRILQNAWNKYGETAFTFTLIEECAPNDAALCAREQFWIDKLKPVFNIAPVAGTTRGIKHPPRSEEFRRQMSAMRAGVRHRPETIERLRQIQRENPYKPSPEHIAKLRAINTGRKLSQEHIDKTRRANLGRKQTRAEVAKRAAALRGRKRTPEQCSRIAAAKQGHGAGRAQSPELIEKRIAPLRGRKRPSKLMSDLRAALRASREAKSAPIKAIIAANLHLTTTALAELAGVCYKTASRYRKEVQCQQPPQNDSASVARESRRSAAPSSRSLSPQQRPTNSPSG